MVNAIEPIVAKYAGDRPAWGHRKLHWLMWADGHVVSASSVERALRRRDLFQTVGYRGERRELAKARKAAFTAHALGRGVAAGLNETTSGGAWRLTGVTDCFTKVEHGWHISPSGTGADPIAAVEIAITTAWRSRASPPPRPRGGVLTARLQQPPVRGPRRTPPDRGLPGPDPAPPTFKPRSLSQELDAAQVFSE